MSNFVDARLHQIRKLGLMFMLCVYIKFTVRLMFMFIFLCVSVVVCVIVFWF